MDSLILLIAVFLLAVSVKFNFKADMNVIAKVEKDWFQRFWTDSSSPKENLTNWG